ncbi:MAG: fused MFS/spermidine synthase [Elusimicrobia bacterium]|nr:fused MFS/spermidine synthase [Elusimicrobiota bacterium]
MSPVQARVLAFFSGACVLVLELVGTRLLSPVFGSSIYVWSALITVTLAALAVGAWLGGLLADGRKPERWPPRLCAAAGLWLAAVPLIRRGVLLAATGLGLKTGALAAAAVLVGGPLTALGALAPLCVRCCASDLARVGRAAGGVSSLSTAGSVLGALAAGFWLLPLLSAPVVVEGTAAFLLAAGAFLAWGPRKGAVGAVAGALACWAAFRTVPPPGSRHHIVRESVDSLYGAVRVVDREDWNSRVLFIDGVANTLAELATLKNTSDYIAAFELAAAARPEAKRALVVGLGGGAIVGRLRDGWGIPADAVEIDPTIVRMAERWFDFKPSGEVIIDDGRRVLEREGPSYGLIYLDAFAGDSSPEQIFSVESFRAAKRRLAPRGLLIVNLIGTATGPDNDLARAAQRTLREVFPSVSMLVASRTLDWRTGITNLVFFAGDAPALPAAGVAGRPELLQYWISVSDRWVDPGPDGRLLTDDSSAMSYLTAPGMARMRTQMLAHREGVEL